MNKFAHSTLQKSPRVSQSPPNGFTLVELIIAAILLAVVGSAAGILSNVATRSIINTTTTANSSSAIDSDIAQIREIAERYTCCAGTCTSNPTTISTYISNGTCQGATNRDSTYYFPVSTTDASRTNADAFAALCTNTNGSILDQLVTDIGTYAPIATSLTPTGVTRNITKNLGNPPTNTLTITYSNTALATTSRIVTIRPTVADWCP